MRFKRILQDIGQLTPAEVQAVKTAALLLILYVQHFPDRHILGRNLHTYTELLCE